MVKWFRFKNIRLVKNNGKNLKNLFKVLKNNKFIKFLRIISQAWLIYSRLICLILEEIFLMALERLSFVF